MDFAAWAEPAQPRPTITRDQVVRQAVALLDESGVDGLTMRRLAERLGVQAATLYNHVRDKGELLALVADAICGEVREPDAHLSWRKRLEALAWDYRQVLLSHQDAARVLTITPPIGPQRLRVIEHVLDALCLAGFTNEDVADASWVFNTYVTGFALDETQALPGGDIPDANSEEVREQMRRGFKALPPERYPTLVALADYLVDASMDRRFGFGLTALLDGLERRLALRRPT
jgi:TetR/AcrR family tetracycline transcriptional repressor